MTPAAANQHDQHGDGDEFDAYRREAMKNPEYAEHWRRISLRPVDRARVLRVERALRTVRRRAERAPR